MSGININGSKKKSLFSRIRQVAVVFLILLFIWPFILIYTPLGSSESSLYSIWNADDDGLSILRQSLEEAQDSEGQPLYDIHSDISTINALNRLNRTGIAVIVSPSGSFDFTETVTLLLFLLRGGSLILVDDFGTGNEVLEPIFSTLENWDDVVNRSGGRIPSLNQFLDNAGIAEDEMDGESDAIPSILGLLGTTLKRIGFNGSALLDGNSYSGSYVKPVIVDISPSSPVTAGVSRIQMELGTAISLQINHTLFDPATGFPVVDSNGNPTFQTDWMPLQKLSVDLLASQISQFGSGLRDLDSRSYDVQIDVPFFPLSTTKSAWIEGSVNEESLAAASSGAESSDFAPSEGEWAGTHFSPYLYLPLAGGFLHFLGDPSILSNRWTEKTAENDNLQFALNMFEVSSENIRSLYPNEPVVVIFDEGHIERNLFDPLFYFSAYSKQITNISMFPLFFPILPILALIVSSRFLPSLKALNPLLTSRVRRVRGVSQFERTLRTLRVQDEYITVVSLKYRELRAVLKKRRGFETDDLNKLISYLVQILGKGSRTQVRNNIRQISSALNKDSTKGSSHANIVGWILFMNDTISKISSKLDKPKSAFDDSFDVDSFDESSDVDSFDTR